MNITGMHSCVGGVICAARCSGIVALDGHGVHNEDGWGSVPQQ